MKFDQADFNIRGEWGQQGVSQLAPISDVVVIVDVLSFSTCVDIVTSRGAIAGARSRAQYLRDVDLALAALGANTGHGAGLDADLG